MRISARADYALRAAVELAAAGGGPVKLEQLASSQDLPPKFLETILGELRRAGLLRTQRGADGGYWLARPASAITLADVIRVADGPLADVRGVRPESVAYAGHAAALAEVWVAVRAAVRAVLEQVTLADVAEGRLPDVVADLTRDEDAWVPHSMAGGGQAPLPTSPRRGRRRGRLGTARPSRPSAAIGRRRSWR